MSHFYNDTSLMPIPNLHSQGTVQKTLFVQVAIEGFVLNKSKNKTNVSMLARTKRQIMNALVPL